MAESEEELKSLFMKVEEESEKDDLKLNIQKIKIMISSAITPWQIDGETMETVTELTFLDSKTIVDGDYCREIKRRLFLPRSKHLLILWLQSPSAVILEPQNIKFQFPLFPHLFAMK